MSETFETIQKPCPNCGAVLDTDSRFCKHCGFDLSNNIQSSVIAPNRTSGSQQNKKLLTVLLAGGLMVLVIVVLIVAYIYRSNPAQSSVGSNESPSPSPSPTMSERANQVEEKILRGETLSEGDITGLSVHELRVLRNVHFARYGRKYDKPGLGDYFYTRSWYKPSDSYSDSMITSTDKANINLILAAERTAGGAASANANASSTPIVGQPAPTLQSTSELSRDTVLSLMRGRYSKEVKVSMSTSSNTGRDLTDIYTQMIKAKVITCRNSGNRWNFCRPSANGNDLYVSEQEGGVTAGSLSLIIGYKVPSSVTGVSRIDQATAYADVIFSFEQTNSYNLYTRWSEVFYRPPNMQVEQRRVLLRLYDDGWRVEAVN